MRLPPAFQSFEKFVDEFKNESDRAAVILGAAKLDTLLYQLLDRYFVPSPSGSDDLLDGDSPLSSFSAKINICYRLGLLSAEFTRALHIVRRIRNAFAHELSGAHLDSGPQADRVNALLFPLRPMPFFGKFRRFFFGNDPSVSSDFKACLALMAGRLQARLLVIETVSESPADFILHGWRKEEEEEEEGPRAEISGTQN